MRKITARLLASSVTGSFALPLNQKGSSNMSQYRAYIIGSDGEFLNSVSLECADDEIAVKRTKQLVGGHHIELWQYTRKIVTLAHNPERTFQA
jgi:hypothetical protein